MQFTNSFNKFKKIHLIARISKKDLNANPGNYPVYSSAKTGGGVFGTWGNYDFNEEMITWSVDGGGDLFHRNKHKN